MDARDLEFGLIRSRMTIQAQSYGPIAGELINSGERLTVIAKFERSLYLECETGEQICYGAWARGNSNTYWGVGMNNSQRCSNCCGICGRGDMVGITLQP